MKKTKKYVAALMAAVMTASSSAAMFSYAEDIQTETPFNMIIGPGTQVDSLRYMISGYITQNNIEAWVYDKETSPEDIVLVGYYQKNENIPVDILAYVESIGYETRLVNFVKEDHEKDGLIEDIDVIKRLINWYISENKLNAGIVPEFELLDGLDSNVLYVEYTAEKTDIPEKLAAYIKDRKIDPELVKTGISGSFSKQNESTVGISFEEFSKLTEDEVKAMFEEKGLTDSMHYRLWTEEKLRNELVCGEVWALLKPNPFPVSNPELADDYKVYWEDDRFASALGLPEELFRFKQGSTVNVDFGDENGSDNNEYCSCYISPKTANNDEAVKLLTAALNYVQLNPYFVGFNYNYRAISGDTTGNIPEKTISNYSFEELLSMSDEELGSFNDKIEGVENVATFGELYSKKIKEAGNDYFNSYTNRGILKVSVEVDNIDILKDLMETKMVENSDGKLVEIEMVSNSKVADLLKIPVEAIAKARTYENTPKLDLDINVNKHSDKIKALVLYEIIFEPSINKLIKNYHIEMPAKSDIISGDANCDGKSLTYNELVKMTDDEIVELNSICVGKNYTKYSFGNDSVPEEEKFRNYLNYVPSFYVGDKDSYEDVSYAAHKKFIAGKETPYISFKIDRYTKMDPNITAEAFGYPKEWKIDVMDGVYGEFGEFRQQLHEYRIEVPIDIISDFEKYIRLEISFSAVNTNEYYSENPYGVTYFGNLIQQFALTGESISNIYGDANCDYEMDMSDVVLVMQALANPDKYGENGTAEVRLTAQGKENADMDGNGLTVGDAQAIQTMLLGIE